MSDLSNQGLDPNVEESSGEFHVVPAGKYPMVIINDNLAPAKSGNGTVLTVTFQIIEGPEAGNTIDLYLNIKNTSEIAQNIGQGTLKRLCTLTDVQYPPADTTLMYGKPIMGTIKVKSFTSNNTGKELKSNDITAFNPISINIQTQTQSNSAPWDNTPFKPPVPDVPF